MMAKMPKYYKILDHNGRSCNGGDMKWSLPAKGNPGAWHEVAGPLERCKNGLHLTDDPIRYRTDLHGKGGRSKVCYEVETEGDTIELQHNELVVRRCRLLRRIPWSKFEPSPVIVLLRHVWKTEGKEWEHSWDRLNDAMGRAFFLAVDCGMSFDLEDFKTISREFNPGYWLNMENAYSRACGASSYLRRSHGQNMSAVLAIEHHLGRKPFIVRESASPNAVKVRLNVGAKFGWHIGMKERRDVTVTSFTADQSQVIACSYKTTGNRDDRKIEKIFRITHDDIAEYHKAVRDFDKKCAVEKESAAVDRSLASVEA